MIQLHIPDYIIKFVNRQKFDGVDYYFDQALQTWFPDVEEISEDDSFFNDFLNGCRCNCGNILLTSNQLVEEGILYERITGSFAFIRTSFEKASPYRQYINYIHTDNNIVNMLELLKTNTLRTEIIAILENKPILKYDF